MTCQAEVLEGLESLTYSKLLKRPKIRRAQSLTQSLAKHVAQKQSRAAANTGTMLKRIDCKTSYEQRLCSSDDVNDVL